jgi:tellurite resistance protein
MDQPADLSLLRGLAQGRYQEFIDAGAAAVGPFEQLIARLESERALLDDNAREMILESAFRVACADGVIEDSEDRQLRSIAKSLDINEGVLELEILQFQRELAANGLEPSL